MGDLDVVNREVYEQPLSNLDLNYNALSKNNTDLILCSGFQAVWNPRAWKWNPGHYDQT